MVGYENGSYFSQLLNGKKQIASSLDGKIAALDPRINLEFLSGKSDIMLINDDGSELRPQEQPQTAGAGENSTRSLKAPKTGFFVPAELADMIKGLSNTIQDQQTLLADQQKMIHELVDTWIKDKEGRK